MSSIAAEDSVVRPLSTPPLDATVPDAIDLDEANQELAHASAPEVFAWAVRTFVADGATGTPLVMTSSFGAQAAVLLHLMSQHAPGTPVIWIDTGHLFPETYRFADTLRRALSLDVRVYSPQMTAAHQEARYGRLWEQGEEGVARYLQLNKVEPLERALAELEPKAWFAGLRRNQTAHRAALRPVEVQDGRYKIHPILRWSDEDVEAYLTANDLPYHPLVAQGYRSIGDVHSTLPTVEGQHPREGRILGKKNECGIHLSRAENRSLTASKL